MKNGLLGNWQFKRHLVDFQAAQIHFAEGEAIFSAMPDLAQLSYHEKGTLRLDNHQKFVFKRAFLYDFQDGIRIYYADGVQNGKLYQDLREISTDLWMGVHQCGADCYWHTLDFGQAIESYVRVVGAQKDYWASTFYQRV